MYVLKNLGQRKNLRVSSNRYSSLVLAVITLAVTQQVLYSDSRDVLFESMPTGDLSVMQEVDADIQVDYIEIFCGGASNVVLLSADTS